MCPSRLRNIVVIGLLSIGMVISADSIMAGEGESCALLDKNPEVLKLEGDWDHIFCGDVNDRKKRATGYHHRPNGQDGDMAYVGGVGERNKATGVYEAAPVFVLEDGEWFQKKRGSTFFPDSCSVTQVANSVAHAAENLTCRYKNGKWGGVSAPKTGLDGYCYGDDGAVLVINGYFKRKSQTIATAWPLLNNVHSKKCLVD